MKTLLLLISKVEDEEQQHPESNPHFSIFLRKRCDTKDAGFVVEQDTFVVVVANSLACGFFLWGGRYRGLQKTLQREIKRVKRSLCVGGAPAWPWPLFPAVDSRIAAVQRA